ncbi:hypothetical protein [uncultured Gelidibacter sp.]|uniref:hypothetical protein n=1 Tax=uncultured Gelidibacter sp. TaxID=259318 RepID=UPI00262975B8|nr:hypothetical protein [uncultured Gelidibacter sp.]
MRNFVLCLCGLVLLTCSPKDTNEQPEAFETLTYTLMEKNDTSKVVYRQNYAMDEEGKVISEDYTNFLFPQHSRVSYFEYNSKGQVVKEVRDGRVHKSILWTNNVAEVLDAQDEKIAEFMFDGDMLSSYRTHLNTSHERHITFIYDSNKNIVSLNVDGETRIEYLDYDTSKRNPLNLIKSIGILRIDYKPFFTNIFSVEKVYPFEGDDYSVPMSFYDYRYIFDSEQRVFQIEDDKSAIYISQFEYR